MWKRKTEDDYKKAEREREKEAIFLGLSMGNILFSLTVAIFFAFCGYVAKPDDLTWMIACFVMSFIACCIGSQLFDDPASIADIFHAGAGTKYPEYSNVICNVCHSVVLLSKNKKCECGGKYEPFDDWKWVEDEIKETEETN